MVGIASGVGTGMQIGSQIMGALEARRIGKYNAKVAQANAQADAFALINEAQQLERLATMIGFEIDVQQEIAAFNEARLSEALERQHGRLVATVGASGLASEGSPIAALEENARQGHIQILAQRYQATLQTRAMEEDQRQKRFAATLSLARSGERIRLGSQQQTLIRAGANQQFTAGVLGAAGSAATGVGRALKLSQSTSSTPGTITKAGSGAPKNIGGL